MNAELPPEDFTFRTITGDMCRRAQKDIRSRPNEAVNHIAYEIAKRRPEMIEALKWDLKAMMGLGCEAAPEGWRKGEFLCADDRRVGASIDHPDGRIVFFIWDDVFFETPVPWDAFCQIGFTKHGLLQSFLYHETRPIRIVGHGSGAAVAACAADWCGCAATTFGCARWKEGAPTSPEAQILNVVNVAVPEPYYGGEALTRQGLTLHIDSRGIPAANHRTLQTYFWTLDRMGLKEQS